MMKFYVDEEVFYVDNYRNLKKMFKEKHKKDLVFSKHKIKIRELESLKERIKNYEKRTSAVFPYKVELQEHRFCFIDKKTNITGHSSEDWYRFKEYVYLILDGFLMGVQSKASH